MSTSAKPALPIFPIQLVKVDIGEIGYSCGAFSDSTVQPTDKFSLNVAVSALDSETKTLQVALEFISKADPANSPFKYEYSLKIKVHGQFQVVDESALPFPIADIKKWAEKNAVVILMPFLRESVYTITQKTGFVPFMIPMIEVSSFRVGAPNHAASAPVPLRMTAPPALSAGSGAEHIAGN